MTIEQSDPNIFELKKLHREIQEKRGFDNDQNEKNSEVSGGTKIDIETEVKAELDL